MKKLLPLPKYYGKIEFPDGRTAWLDSFVPPGRKTASHYSLVICSPVLEEAPEIKHFNNVAEAFKALAEIQKEALLDL